MRERSYLALFAFPLAWFAATVVAPPTGGLAPQPEKPASPNKYSEPRQSTQPEMSTPKLHPQIVRKLKTGCDVIRDYFALREESAPADPSRVLVTVRDEKGQKSLTLVDATKRAEPTCDIPREYLTKVQTSFVFIPDPSESALALETDRFLDAIRLAFAARSYIPYKPSILPWKGSRFGEADFKKDNSENEEAPEPSRPGLWLFRSTIDDRDLRLVYLIGDTPSIGISKVQFQNAVLQFGSLQGFWPFHDRRLRLQRTPSPNRPELVTLKIVGPVFSGSISSMGEAIQHLCPLAALPTWHCPIWDVQATSGTAEVSDLDELLRSSIGDLACVSFRQIANVSPLRQVLGQLKGRTAILSESDTVFGQQLFDEKDQLAKDLDLERFSYSRNLVNLRTAYESDKDLMARIFPKSVRPDQLALEFGSAREPSDAIPTFSPENIAVSQQIGLRHLASSLQRRDFSNLVILGSDQLDSIFLARFFQDESPNLRIVLEQSDTLLDREAGSVSLRGILTFSQQPTGSVAMQPVRWKQMEFPDGLALGVYRACQQQLFKPKSTDSEDTRYLVASVVGYDGEWPIDVVSRENGVSNVAFKKFDEMRAFIAFLGLLGWLTLVPMVTWILGGSDTAVGKMLLSLAPFCRRPEIEPRAVDHHSRLLAALHWRGGSVGGFLRLVVAQCQWVAVPSISRKLRIVASWLRKCATRAVPIVDEVDGSDEPLRKRWLVVSSVTGMVTLLVPVSAAVFACSKVSGTYLDPAITARFFYFGNGVSPILPLTALLLALHACAWSRVRACYLRSYAFYPSPGPLPIHSKTSQADSRVELPNLLKAVRDRANVFFDGWLLILWAVAALAVHLYDARIRDVEIELSGDWSSWVWTTLFFGVGTMILRATAHFWWLWISLKRLALRIEYHPVRLGCTTLPDRVSWTSIWSLGGTRPTMVSLQMSSDYLSALSKCSPNPLSGVSEALGLGEKIDQFIASAQLGKGRELKTLWCIHRRLGKVTNHFVYELNQNHWAGLRIKGWHHSNDENSSKRELSMFPLNVKRGDNGTQTIEKAEVDQCAKMMNEFVALQFAAFIRYSFMQLRNLLGFIATASSLLFIALNVYPFQPMGTLTNFASFLFAVCAILTVTAFYQMDRDPLLSRLSNTDAGKLDAGFGWRILQFGALPAVTFLATHFPPIGQALVKIVQIIPGLAKM